MTEFRKLLDELRVCDRNALVRESSSGLCFAHSWDWWSPDCHASSELPSQPLIIPGRMLCLPDVDAAHRDQWRHRLAIVSSRLSLRLDLEKRWFDLLRTSVLHALEEKQSVVVVRGTATSEIVSRAAVLFGLPMVDCRISDQEVDHSHTLTNWISACIQNVETEAESQRDSIPIFRIWISPRCFVGDHELHEGQSSAPPEADSTAFRVATRTVVLNCRRGGNIHTAIRNHILQQHNLHCPVIVAADAMQGLSSDEDIKDGWVPWIVDPAKNADTDSSLTRSLIVNAHESTIRLDRNPRDRTEDPASRSDPLSAPNDWLCHWTRPAQGPWPEETRNDFLDQLILGCPSADRSALAAVLRMISTGKLKASSAGIRGSYAVVSLTAVPLSEFRQRRVFRKHRHRFDFEPFGIAIRRTCLESIGVRPVIYGTDTDWNQLSNDERPFFQKATRDSSTSNLDEQEWRVQGDIPLSHFGADDVVLFTDLAEQQSMLQQCTKWRVLVVPPSSTEPVNSDINAGDSRNA